jgi:hypothetical protein
VLTLMSPFGRSRRRGCFIARSAATAGLPLRVRRDMKRKPILGVERDIDGWASVDAEADP